MPKRTLRVTATAERHIEQALDWWQRNREKAPRRLESDLAAAFTMLAEDPEIGASSAEFPGVRRLTIRRVRYEVYYRATEAMVEVLAVWHTSRGDKPKL